MERNWKEMEPTPGNIIRLEIGIIWVSIRTFFLWIKLAVLKTVFQLMRNGYI